MLSWLIVGAHGELHCPKYLILILLQQRIFLPGIVVILQQSTTFSVMAISFFCCTCFL